jgi:chloramphenicol O-acetyltransferase
MNYKQIKAVDFLIRQLIKDKEQPLIVSCGSKIISAVFTEPYSNVNLSSEETELISDFHQQMVGTISELSFKHELTDEEYFRLVVYFVNLPFNKFNTKSIPYGYTDLLNIDVFSDNVHLNTMPEESFLIWFDEQTNFSPLGLKV